MHVPCCLLRNRILNLDFIQAQIGQYVAHLSSVFFRNSASVNDVYKTIPWPMNMAQPDVYTGDKQIYLFESFVGVYVYALPPQYLGSEWRCNSIYYQSSSLALHTTTITTSKIVSTWHAVRLLTRAGVIARRIFFMALQATMEFTGAVLVLWIGMLLLLT